MIGWQCWLPQNKGIEFRLGIPVREIIVDGGNSALPIFFCSACLNEEDTSMRTKVTMPAFSKERLRAMVRPRQRKGDSLNLHRGEPRWGRTLLSRGNIVALVASLVALGVDVVPARIAHAATSVPCSAADLVQAINLASPVDELSLAQS